MKSLLLILFFITSFFVRIMRWFAFMQQKEYRFDRIKLFLFSKEGISELFRFLPNKSDFSRTGLKRPKLTPRVLLLISFFVVLSGLYFYYSLRFGYEYLLTLYPYPMWYSLVLVLCVAVLYLISIPIFVLVSVLPTVLIAYVQTYQVLYLARKKLRTHAPKVIGITGSYGKTSTKLLLAHVLSQKYSVFMTPKSFNTKYSVAKSVVDGYSGQEIAIIEYGAYRKGEIKELTKWVQPEFAIVTGLTEQHLGLFGSVENIISAKAELVSSLPHKATVVCNVYEEKTIQICELGSTSNSAQILEVAPGSKVAPLERVTVTDLGKLKVTWQGTTIQTQLYGKQNQELIRLVIATAQKFGLSREQIISGLETFVPNEKFIYMYSLNSGLRVLDDGDTSNPKGFQAIIDLAKQIKAEKRVLITPGIVDLGGRSRAIHLELARSAKKIFDQVIFVGEVGKEEFVTLFGENCITHREQFAEVINSMKSTDLVVLEGRMPAWVLEQLK